MSSDGGSWAPFGPSEGDDDERRDEEEELDLGPDTPLAWPEPSVQPQWQPQPQPEPEPGPGPEPEPLPVSAPPPVHQWQGPPPAPFGAPSARTSGNATAALILGIVGLFMCPLVASVPAIALGSGAKKEIRANPGMGGDAMATWGIVLGWVGTAIGILFLLVLAFGLASIQVIAEAWASAHAHAASMVARIGAARSTRRPATSNTAKATTHTAP